MELVEGAEYNVSIKHKFKGRFLRYEDKGPKGREVKVAIFATDDGANPALRILPVDAIEATPIEGSSK